MSHGIIQVFCRCSFLVSICTGFLDENADEVGDLQMEKLSKIDRCMRVLENVSENGLEAHL